MNIFVLDTNPAKAAQYHCDSHVVKMILESAQILSTALSVMGVNHDGYKPTHINHPCCRWANDLRNWIWLRTLARHLGEEYTYRYGKVHKSIAVINSLPIPEVNMRSPTDFAVAMPTDYITYTSCQMTNRAWEYRIDYVASYRKYYQSKVDSIRVAYTRRKPPSWLDMTVAA